MENLIIKILIAHTLGDFVFQSNRMVQSIHNKGLKSGYLYIHAAIHFVLLSILLPFQWVYIFSSFLLAVAHLLIDMFTKIILRNRLNSLYVFIIDQLLHIVSILAFVHYFKPIDFYVFEIKNFGILILSLIGLTTFGAVLIKKILEIFDFPLPEKGLRDAGKYIGMLERILIFIFVVNSFWGGIGFLLAAKSIFRFGDLKENKEIKLTEYILVGTFLSFLLAIIIGVIYVKCQSVM